MIVRFEVNQDRKHTYARSGRSFGSYTRICLRCGWTFRPRHKQHDRKECDSILADPREARLGRSEALGAPDGR